MSERFIYKSALAPYMNGFISLKEAAGVHTLRSKWILLEIDKFYTSNEITDASVTSDIITRWRKTRINDSPGTIYTKYSVWSQLTRFMCRQGIECYIPPLPDNRSAKHGFTPYIFTREQINDIMDKSAGLRLYDRHMDCALMIVPAITRLLYSTGLRVSEALSIRNRDVKLEDGHIHVRKTKNGHERVVPVCDSLKTVLQQYMYYRDKMPLRNTSEPDAYLFIRTNGMPCGASTVYTWFKRVLKECGIPHVGNHHGPRLHDLRHSYSVHALEQMAREGMDLYAGMPVLSTCLGHRSLSATEQYVRLTREMYPDLAAMTSPVNAFIYSKVRKGVSYED